jgi:cation/acetate symporter
MSALAVIAIASDPSGGGQTIGTPALNLAIFAGFVVVTLAIVVWASGGNQTTTDFFAGGRAFTGRQNGIAIGGDYLSAASFLGIAGAIALNGYDGFMYSVGFLVGWLILLLLVAEPLRNTGRYTLADVLTFRLRPGPVRTAAAISTLAISLFYLTAQMAGAGALVNLLLGVSGSMGQNLTIAAVGLLMVLYVLIGGMKGTTWVQIVKAVLLLAAAVLLTLWVLGRAGFNPSGLLSDAAAASPAGRSVLRPGLLYGSTPTAKIDMFSQSIALVLGTAGLPHILMRLYTVPNAREARRSVVWSTWLIGIFYLMMLVLGFAAMWLVGAARIQSAPGKANSAVPLLAFQLGGTVLLGIVAAVAFATILAVVAGLTISASASFAHDIYAGVLRRRVAEQDDEIRIARITAVVIGLLAIAGGMYAKNQNVAFLIALTFSVAASANLPVLLYSLYWRGLTTRGALWGIYGGLISSIGLIMLSPVVSGSSSSLIGNQDIDFAVFPLENPGIVSVPLAFLLGWLGSVTDRRPADPARFARIQVRALTGVGAAKASRRH